MILVKMLTAGTWNAVSIGLNNEELSVLLDKKKVLVCRGDDALGFDAIFIAVADTREELYDKVSSALNEMVPDAKHQLHRLPGSDEQN